MHDCNPNSWETEGVRTHIQGKHGLHMSSRTGWSTQQEPVKNNQANKQQQEKIKGADSSCHSYVLCDLGL
jgi:hypothetical protein